MLNQTKCDESDCNAALVLFNKISRKPVGKLNVMELEFLKNYNHFEKR